MECPLERDDRIAETVLRSLNVGEDVYGLISELDKIILEGPFINKLGYAFCNALANRGLIHVGNIVELTEKELINRFPAKNFRKKIPALKSLFAEAGLSLNSGSAVWKEYRKRVQPYTRLMRGRPDYIPANYEHL